MTALLTGILLAGLAILLWLSTSRLLSMRRLATAVPAAPAGNAGPAPGSAPDEHEEATSAPAAGTGTATGSSTSAHRAGLSAGTAKLLAGASRTGIITGYLSVLATFAVVRMVLGFPLWAFLVWTLAGLVLLASVWFAARAFPALPWLPPTGRRAQISSTVVEVIVAVLIFAALFAPLLLA